MDKKAPALYYDHATICLKPEFLGDEWRREFAKPRLTPDGYLNMIISHDFLLEMQGISIPIHSMGRINSNRRVIAEARSLVGGSCGDILRRYSGLKGISDPHFTLHGLLDYSEVGRKISKAKKHREDIEDYFPEDFRLPEGARIEFAPTFKAIRGIEYFIDDRTPSEEKGSRGPFLFTGETFVDRIKNLLSAYELVGAHEKWMEDEQRELFHQRRASENPTSFSTRVKIAKLVID